MEVLRQIKKDKVKPAIILKSEAKDYTNEPFFVKKRERAKEALDKYGIPEHFSTSSK